MNLLNQYDDDRLVTLYMEGQDEAFDVLIARHKDRLYSYILFMAQQNADLADDLFQDTFVKAIFQIRQGKYTAHNRFYSWISCIAHNLMADHFRQNTSAQFISDNDVNMEVYNAATFYDTDVDQALSNERTLQNLQYLISCLSPEQQEIIEQRYFKNMTFKEIVAQSNINMNTALARASYACQNIRRLAAKQGISLEWY